MAIAKRCWAISRNGSLVQDHSDYSRPVRTMLFRTKTHATAWLEDNPYWVKLKAKPVKIKVTITEI